MDVQSRQDAHLARVFVMIFLFSALQLTAEAITVGQAHAVGDSGTIINTDNGIDWAIQKSSESDTLNCTYAVLTDEIWAVGRRGVIIHAQDGGGPIGD